MRPSVRILVAIAVVCVLAAVSRTPSAPASTPVPKTGATDRDVLVALYHATGGDNWINNENWLSDAPISTWYGVTTDESGRVIELGLSWNQLNGTIPTELGNLTALMNLYLGWNQLGGKIPPELGNLTNLWSLNLSENLLSGSIPSELGNLANLYRLNLEDNHLIGTVPLQLDRLTNLNVWYLSGNRLDGYLSAGWQDVEANDFDELGLVFCIAPSTPLTAATDRDALVALYQATAGDYWINNSNWLSDASLNTWYGVTTDEGGRVIRLNLSENELWGTIPSKLGNLMKLQGLSLGQSVRRNEPVRVG